MNLLFLCPPTYRRTSVLQHQVWAENRNGQGEHVCLYKKYAQQFVNELTLFFPDNQWYVLVGT